MSEFTRKNQKYLRPKYALILLFISICYYIYVSKREKKMRKQIKYGQRAIVNNQRGLTDEQEAVRELQGYMAGGVNPNGERGLVSDLAQKYFGEMDVENLLAGQVMERSLGVSKA